MCGRFTLSLPSKRLAERFGLSLDELDYTPRYNIAPGQQALVISADHPTQLRYAHWGLIPRWAKDPKIGYKMINARSETLLEKPSYKKPFLENRCLIPADGFFEWSHQGKHSTPYRIMLKSGDIFSFAGLCERWKDSLGHVIPSFTIITTPPNPLIKKIHDRMPAILHPEKESSWLDMNQPTEIVLKLLAPYPAEQMQAVRVSSLVNNPRNDRPEIIQSFSIER